MHGGMTQSARERALERQARLLPGREAALEVDDLGEPGVLQHPAGRCRSRAAGAGDQDRLLLPLGDLVHALGELARGDVARARQVAGGVGRRVGERERQDPLLLQVGLVDAGEAAGEDHHAAAEARLVHDGGEEGDVVADALQGAGATVTKKLNIGAREAELTGEAQPQKHDSSTNGLIAMAKAAV